MKMLKTLALAVAGGLLVLSGFTYYPAGDQSPAEDRASLEHPRPRLTALPFSLGQVLDYFNEAFGKRPFKNDDGSFVYVDRENSDETAIVMVSEFETNLDLVLWATGDYGVNYIREFFEAPFFLRAESEQLYRLLDGGPGVRSLALERFNVQMRVAEAGRWVHVALQFRPSDLYRPHLTLGTIRPLGSIDKCRFAESERQESFLVVPRKVQSRKL